MNKIDKKEFIEIISKIHSAESEQGKVYSSIAVHGSVCSGIRESTGNPFKIDLDKLYEAYRISHKLRTLIFKAYVGKVQSPSYAILKAANLA